MADRSRRDARHEPRGGIVVKVLHHPHERTLSPKLWTVGSHRHGSAFSSAPPTRTAICATRLAEDASGRSSAAGCRRAADHRSKFFRRQRREQDWRSRGRSRGTRGASVRANDPAAAVRRQKLASGPATSCSSCLFPRAHYFVELKRETLGAFAVSARDVIAQLANESFGAGHVRFRNIVGAVVDMPMRSHFSAAEAFFCDHFARLTCLPEISNVGPPD